MPIFSLSELEKGNVSPQSGKHSLVRFAQMSVFLEKELQSVLL